MLTKVKCSQFYILGILIQNGRIAELCTVVNKESIVLSCLIVIIFWQLLCLSYSWPTVLSLSSIVDLFDSCSEQTSRLYSRSQRVKERAHATSPVYDSPQLWKYATHSWCLPWCSVRNLLQKVGQAFIPKSRSGFHS